MLRGFMGFKSRGRKKQSTVSELVITQFCGVSDLGRHYRHLGLVNPTGPCRLALYFPYTGLNTSNKIST